MQIPIINATSHPFPAYATAAASGMDLRAHLAEPLIISPWQRALVNTGIAIALPQGFEGQVRPRSGLALNKGITVLNSPGTIDADYRGAIKVLLVNLSDQLFEVKDGDRIAQLVIAKYEHIVWEPVVSLPSTVRDKGGYGSTGLE